MRNKEKIKLIVSKYEDLGLRSYNDVLGAFDFLKKIGFTADQIGLHGISLGGSTAIFAAANEPTIKAIWTDSTLAEFNLILKVRRAELMRFILTVKKTRMRSGSLMLLPI